MVTRRQRTYVLQAFRGRTQSSPFFFFFFAPNYSLPVAAAARQGRELAIVDISKATSVISEDVIDTMTRLGMLKYSDGEHHIIATPVRSSSCIVVEPA